MRKRNKKTLSASIPTDIKLKFDKYCLNNRLNRSGIIENIIIRYINNISNLLSKGDIQ